jgi:hypothetical protein
MAHKEYRVRRELKVLLVAVVALVHRVLKALKEHKEHKVYKELNRQGIMDKVIQLKILLLQQRILHILPHQVLGQPVQHLLLDKE